MDAILKQYKRSHIIYGAEQPYCFAVCKDTPRVVELCPPKLCHKLGYWELVLEAAGVCRVVCVLCIVWCLLCVCGVWCVCVVCGVAWRVLRVYSVCSAVYSEVGVG